MNKKNKQTIKELREICQATGPSKSMQTVFGLFARTFSIYATWFFIRTTITPNQITTFGTILYIIGVGLYISGNYWLMLIGFFLFIIETILDASDGEIHRYRKYKGGYGASYVEPLSHDIKYGLMFLPIAYGAYIISGNSLVLIAGGATSIFKLLFRITEIRFFYGVTKLLTTKGQIDNTAQFDKTPGIRRIIYILYRQIATSTGMLIPLFIATIYNRIDLFIYIYAFIFGIIWISLLIRQILRFSKISKQVIDRHTHLQNIKKRIDNKKILVFDLDGTLLDSMGTFGDIASFLISWEHKISRKKAKQMYINTSGIPFFQQLDILFPNYSRNKEISRIFEEKKVHATEHLEMDEDELSALKKLSQGGYKLAVSSNNSQENVDKFNKFTNLNFDYVLGYKENFSKGEGHFNFIFKKENVSKDEIIFIGDSISDMERAQKLGVDFIAKVGTFSDKDFENRNPNVITIKHLGELLDIL